MYRTPEEIKKGMECCSKSDSCPQECPYYDVPSCGSVSKLDALAFIQQIEAQVPKWISVEERLPENGDLVLVIASGKPRENITLIDAILIASCWAEEGWIADGFDNWDGLDVAYWMPLPEPPKEG